MVKKQTLFLITAVLSLTFTACGTNVSNQTTQGVIERSQQNESTEAQLSDTEIQPGEDESEQVGTNETSGSNILIVYFTVPETDGVDTVAGASRVVTGEGVLGNTEFIATEIQKNLGGDLFKIETVQEYPGTHDALLEFAYNEKTEQARPELSTHIENLDAYDYIFVGYPNWNADLPMPLYTFLEEYDFSGKTLIPFVTHGGSGFSGTVSTIQKLQPDATVVENGLSVSRNSVADAQDEVKAWTESLFN